MSLEAANLQAVQYSAGRKRILDGVSFSVAEHEIFALIGPSGCGKSTTLRLISGLEAPSAGTVTVFGRPAGSYSAPERLVATVWQGRALFPNMSVRRNVEFGLRVRDVPPVERDQRVARIGQRLRISGLLDRDVASLSGGEQQRVALARALVLGPRLLLLDEPFTGLDPVLRLGLQADIRSLQVESGKTFVLVSHDIEITLAMADRVAVMLAGRIVQTGTPEEIRGRPATAFVATLIGRLNVVSGVQRVASGPDGFVAVSCPGSSDVWSGRGGVALGDSEVSYAIDPQHVVVGGGGECRVRAFLRSIELRDWDRLLYFELPNGEGFRVSQPRRDASPTTRIGDDVGLSWNPEDGLVVRREGFEG